MTAYRWTNYPNFPNIPPQGRRIIPGDFPNNKYKSINGQEIRIMRGLKQTLDTLVLTYANQPDEEVTHSFLRFYAAQSGTFGSFKLPRSQGVGIWAGWTGNSELQRRLVDSRWRFKKRVAFQSVRPGISNITIELLCVNGPATRGITPVTDRSVDSRNLQIRQPTFGSAAFNFPSLRPTYRKMTQGDYNVKIFQGPDGTEVRALDGPKGDDMLDLRFDNISDADCLKITDHYTRVKGTWGEFHLPREEYLGAGLDMDDIDNGRYRNHWLFSNRWVYDKAPTLTFVRPGRVSVAVMLRCPHPDGRNNP